MDAQTGSKTMEKDITQIKQTECWLSTAKIALNRAMKNEDAAERAIWTRIIEEVTMITK